MAYSKKEIEGMNDMIADDSISEKEKDMYRGLLENDKPKAKAKSKSKSKKKPATKKSKAEAEKELANKVGKTEEECEDILEQYKSLRSKAKARTKKATKTKEQSKAQGKTEPSGEKTPQAEIETATEKVEKKIEKKIEKVEKAEKPKADATPKAKVEAKKKVEKVVEKVADESLDAVADMVKAIMSSLAKYDKVVAKKELIKLRDALNKEIAKYGDGGMVKGYDIQASLINVGNNPSYAKGGSVVKQVRLDDGKLYNEIAYTKKDLKGKPTNETYVQYELVEKQFAKGGSIKDMLNDDNVSFADFYNYLQDEDKGDWDSINSEDIVRMYIDDMNSQDVDVEHIEKVVDGENASSEELYGINLGNSMNTPYPINNKQDLYDALELDYYAKGGTLDVPNLNDGDNIMDYGRGGMISVKDTLDEALRKLTPNQKKIYNKHLERTKKLGEGFNGFTDDSLADYVNGWYGEDIVNRMDFSGVNSFNLGYKVVAMDMSQKEDDFWEFHDNYAKGGKTQGYNDKDDESIGMRNKGKKSQSRKSRRDESAGMEKAGGRRKYADVGTMDNFTSSIDLGRFQKMKNRGMFGAGGDLGNIAKPYNIQEGMISVGNNVKFFKKGGKTKKDWVQKVTSSPNFDKGAFTKKADNRGMTTKAFMKEVLSNPDDYTLKTRRQAQFMKNIQ